MAEENGKDYSTFYIGGLIIVAIIGVMMLKARETEHLDEMASAQTADAAFQAANAKRKAGANVFE